MSFFTGDIEQDQLPNGSQISAGPQTGFTQNFEAAYAEQAHVRSAFGADEDMANLEQQQIDKLYSLTGQRLPSIFPGIYSNNGSGSSKQESFAVMHYLNGEQLDADQQPLVAGAQAQMDKYDALARQHGLMTYDQMFKQVQANAQQMVNNAADVANRSDGIVGWLGRTAGAVMGSNTYRDPINIATAALGGVGKTALARVASEIGIAGVGQAVELMTGAAENQQLLGQKITSTDEAEQIAGAALGAGALRGAGELGAVGFKAIVRRFGARAPDVTAAAIAKEAQDAIGPSPYGTSRIAQGLHESEVIDAINRDVPLNMPAPANGAPQFSIGAFASRDTDHLFAGTSEPLSRIFENLPASGDAARQKIAEANRALSDFTEKVESADTKAETLAAQVEYSSAELMPPEQIAAMQVKLDKVNQAIADLPSLDTSARRRGRRAASLAASKNDLEAAISRADAMQADVTALAGQRDAAVQGASDIRLKRAQIVADIARNVPGIKRTVVAKDLISNMGADEARPIAARVPVTADEAEAATSAPATEPKAARVIAAPEGAAPGVGETVDVGQASGPVDLDHEIVVGVDHSNPYYNPARDEWLPSPIYSTIRDILKEHADDDALVASMKACLI